MCHSSCNPCCRPRVCCPSYRYGYDGHNHHNYYGLNSSYLFSARYNDYNPYNFSKYLNHHHGGCCGLGIYGGRYSGLY
jgi:hypothetical protein